eukprot:PhM_4_TR21/c0_g1_i1/m.87040
MSDEPTSDVGSSSVVTLATQQQPPTTKPKVAKKYPYTARQAAYQRRAIRFFKKYAPDELPLINERLEKYINREEVLFADLVEQYGPEPEEAKSIVPAAAGQENGTTQLDEVAVAIEAYRCRRRVMLQWMHFTACTRQHALLQSLRVDHEQKLSAQCRELAARLLSLQIQHTRTVNRMTKEYNDLSTEKDKVERFIADLMRENIRLAEEGKKLQVRTASLEADKTAKYSTLKEAADRALDEMRELTETLHEKEAHIFKLEGRLMKGGAHVQSIQDELDDVQRKFAHQRNVYEEQIEDLKMKLSAAEAKARDSERQRDDDFLTQYTRRRDGDDAAQSSTTMMTSAAACPQCRVNEERLALEGTRIVHLQECLRDAESKLSDVISATSASEGAIKDLTEENAILYARLGEARDVAKQLEEELGDRDRSMQSAMHRLVPNVPTVQADARARRQLDLLQALLQKHDLESGEVTMEELSLQSFFAREADEAEKRSLRKTLRQVHDPEQSAASMMSNNSNNKFKESELITTAMPPNFMQIMQGQKSGDEAAGRRPASNSFLHQSRVTSNTLGTPKDRREYLFSYPIRNAKQQQ